ncbi:MAG: hypothetical protein R2838_01990 [Caldilineaceae bacterium]
MITADLWQRQPGYQHLRNEFRTYRDFVAAIPFRFRHLPVFITETDPTDPARGWEPADNLGWVQTAYAEMRGLERRSAAPADPGAAALPLARGHPPRPRAVVHRRPAGHRRRLQGRAGFARQRPLPCAPAAQAGAGGA